MIKMGKILSDTLLIAVRVAVAIPVGRYFPSLYESRERFFKAG